MKPNDIYIAVCCWNDHLCNNAFEDLYERLKSDPIIPNVKRIKWPNLMILSYSNLTVWIEIINSDLTSVINIAERRPDYFWTNKVEARQYLSGCGSRRFDNFQDIVKFLRYTRLMEKRKNK